MESKKLPNIRNLLYSFRSHTPWNYSCKSYQAIISLKLFLATALFNVKPTHEGVSGHVHPYVHTLLIHTYPHKPQSKTKATICNHQADSPLYVWSDLAISKFRKSMVIHDAKCPYWDQVSLNNTNPTLITKFENSVWTQMISDWRKLRACKQHTEFIHQRLQCLLIIIPDGQLTTKQNDQSFYNSMKTALKRQNCQIY